MKVIVTPISVVVGLLSAVVASKIFNQVWQLVDDQEPPGPKDRDVDTVKLVMASVVQGIIFRLTRVAADRGLRRTVQSLTGSWPGDKKADPA